MNKAITDLEKLRINVVSISFNIPDEWNGDSKVEFTKGCVSAEGDVRTEGGADDEYFSTELTKEQTYELYLKMKVYYNEC
jgi:hypothetical protein